MDYSSYSLTSYSYSNTALSRVEAYKRSSVYYSSNKPYSDPYLYSRLSYTNSNEAYARAR